MAATSPEVLIDQPGASRADRSRPHIAALTGLRGFAALVVVVVHVSSLSPHPWVGFPTYGPMALFVLSGFLLFQPWSRWLEGFAPRPRVRSFVRRRLFRIFPAYLSVLLVVTLIYPPARPDGAADWLRALTLTNIYSPDGMPHGLFQTWSLGTELSWYALLPPVGLFLGLMVRRVGVSATKAVVAMLLVGALVSLGWHALFLVHVEDLAHRLTFPRWLPTYVVCFFAGALVGHLRVLQSAAVGGRSRVLDWVEANQFLVLVCGLAAGILGASRFGGPWTFEATTTAEHAIRYVAMLTMAVLLLAGAAVTRPGGLFHVLLGQRLTEAVGRWSYGIYLWHMPVLVLLHRELGAPTSAMSQMIWVLGITLVATGLGAVTYAFVEQPAVRWSRGRDSRR